ALALELRSLDVQHGLRRLLTAHDAVTGARQREDEPRAERLAAHSVMAGTVRASEDDAEPWDHAVAHRVHHLGAAPDDPVLFALFADHEAVDVVEEQQRYTRLVAVEDEPCGFVGGFGVDDAADLDPSTSLDDALLIGDDADRVPTESRGAAHQ